LATLTGAQVGFLVLGVVFIALGCAAVVIRGGVAKRRLQPARSADRRVRRSLWIGVLWIAIGIYWVFYALH
jgi:hypothetical protein